MKVERDLFAVIGTFFVIVAIVYGVVTGWGEPVGVACMGCAPVSAARDRAVRVVVVVGAGISGALATEHGHHQRTNRPRRPRPAPR